MKLLAKIGRPASILLIILGFLSLIGAFVMPIPSLTGQIWLDREKRMLEIRTDSPLAANWLQKAGIKIYPQDSLYYLGLEIDPSFRLPTENGQILVYKSAVLITLIDGKDEMRFYSSASNLGEALWDRGIEVTSGDKLTYSLDTPLDEPLQVVMDRGLPVSIIIGDDRIQSLTSARTVGVALIDAGISLQGLDYSIPAADQPIPEKREIEVVRVREELLLEDNPIPFAEERIPDDSMVIGEQKILQNGLDGIQSVVVRIRLANNNEVSSQEEWQWISRQPVTQQTAYGTRVVMGASPDGMVNYWLAKEVQIFSYRDTGQPTATGIWPYYGVIAVSPEWFSILRGTSIYVPGYGVGTVLDVCPGCSGKDMIDVFIPLDDYVPWNKTETVYFMPPVPSGFSGDLP